MCSSDLYHGKNKLVALGSTGMTDTDEAPEGLVRFLEDVRPWER